MKLLVDENLSPNLPVSVEDLFPGSLHVREAYLGSTSDAKIWEYARRNGFIVLTKDQDFVTLSLIWGAPPKVVLLEIGNCSTAEVERIVRTNAVRFAEFDGDAARASLILR